MREVSYFNEKINNNFVLEQLFTPKPAFFLIHCVITLKLSLSLDLRALSSAAFSPPFVHSLFLLDFVVRTLSHIQCSVSC